jgi:very-short-patch-repair endonuclease
MNEVVRRRLLKFREKLLDPTKRNRLLNFRVTRASTVRIVDELPAEIFRILCQDGKPFGFVPELEAGDPTHTERTPDDSADTLPDGLADGEVAACDQASSGRADSPEPDFTREFRPYDSANVSARHRNSDLATDLDSARLDHNLLRIYQQARSSLEEQGYNILFLSLGAIEWFDEDALKRPLLAPILLLPVELRRRSPRSPFRLFPVDDEPLLNPSLAMKLERELGLSLPEMPDDVEDWNVQELFAELADGIKEQPGWRVLNDVYLGLFSFTKFIMYKDLETFADWFSENRLIRTLCTSGEEGPPNASAERDALLDELPASDEEESTRIDDRIDPASTFQVLDADSSQQEAILAVKSGQDLVLEGPPGTGKSQTITNIIAECLATDRRVLFVSEKMAALEVVFNRLRDVGLSDFCLELHSRHASKRKVVEELARTLALRQDSVSTNGDDELARLSVVRDRLNGYVDALCEPLEPLERTPFHAIGRCVTLQDTTEVVATLPDVHAWTKARLDDALDRLQRFCGAWTALRERFPSVDEHPWRGACLEEMGYQDSVSIRRALDDTLSTLDEATASAERLSEETGVATPESLEAAGDLLDLVDFVGATPHPSIESLRDSAWTGPGLEVTDLIDLTESFREKIDGLREHWKSSLLDASDLDGLLDRQRRGYGALRVLKPSWWSDRRVLRTYLATGESLTVREQLVGDLERAVEARKLRERVRAAKERGRVLFGPLWKDDESDPKALREFSEWVTSFRRFVLGEEAEKRMRLAVEGFRDTASVERLASDLSQDLEKLRDAWGALRLAAKIDEGRAFVDGLDRTSLDELRSRVETMRTEIESLHDWGHYVGAESACQEIGLTEFLATAQSTKVDPDELTPAFERLFFNTWLDYAFSERPALRQFSRQEHQRAIEEFRELDLGQLRLARDRLRDRLFALLPDASWPSSERSELGILQREVRRKRGHKPLRKLFQMIPGTLTRLKPCFLMGPLSVAQFLDPGVIEFDVVIFDEASQIAPEDALGAIARGKQLVVVGDSRQLPPTAFFQGERIETEPEDDDTPDLESILDECVVASFPRRMLRWHYRSRHESLIAFSNEHFYEGRLNTFPSASRDGGELGVEFVYVEDGVYDRGKSQSNRVEADRVAQAVLEHFRTRPELSLGVGTFSQAQQMAILDRLEELRRQDESLEEFFAEGRPEHFFVKNLENIQGDERDLILLSVGYGRDASGKLHFNFGPLNKSGGGRRLNVLVTRARRKLTVFSSIRGSDIDDTRVTGQGALLLKHYLDFAEHGSRVQASDADDRETPATQGFAACVHDTLRDGGFDVERQVGCSKVRLDLAVKDADDEDRFLLGIECDGASYRTPGSARDRDRLRPQVLEGLGWHLYRIWSTEWLRNPTAEMERLRDVIEAVRRGEREHEVLPLLARAAGKRVETSSAQTSKAEDEDEDDSEKNGPGKRFPGVASYATVASATLGDPDDFGKDDAEIIVRLLQIVEAESPIHVDEAARRVAASYGITRLTKTVQDRVARSVEMTGRDGTLFHRGDFLWNDESGVAVPRARDSELVPREPELIAPEEFAEAAILVLAREFRLVRDDLIGQVAKILGFRHAGSRLRKHVSHGIDRLIETERAIEEEGQLRLIENENHEVT